MRRVWPNITRKGEAPADADDWKGKPDKARVVFAGAGQALTHEAGRAGPVSDNCASDM